MPATDSYVRDLKKMHWVFAVSCIALFATTIWMMAADHSEEWTDHQRTWERIQETALSSEASQIMSSAGTHATDELNKKQDAAKKPGSQGCRQTARRH
jgi:hypothetical protein